MLRGYKCDLHIHTCLSPCADLDMYPSAVVETSIAKSLDIIGVCDHNASENVRYVIKAAEGKPLVVFPGMEITTREEVHILALFEKIDELYGLQKIIYESLAGMNREEIFGCQPIVNELDEVEGFNERLLIGSSSLSLHAIVETIHKFNGIAIAAHIDRESFSVLSQLGFVSPDIQFDALEISYRTGKEEARIKYPELSSYTFVESSDAHFIRDIGKRTSVVYMKKPAISEFKMALEGRDGRYIEG
jgi:predicted metal-dependent phosphoesterase TrpH